MSTLEIILSRMISDTEFRELLFVDLDQAVAEYDLPADEYARLKELSRAEIGALAVEDRKSMAKLNGNLQIANFYWGTS